MNKKKIVIIASAVALVAILMVVGYLSSGLVDPKNQVWGNNLTVYSYVSSGKTYDSIEIAMAEVDEHYSEEKLLGTVRTGNVTIIFLLSEGQAGEHGTSCVKAHEFVTVDGGYNHKGGRTTTFEGSVHYDSYDWQTTMRSDLSNSTKKTYRSIIGKGKKYTVLPAWGISDTGEVKDVTVDGQGIDEVIPFSHDGTDYYLWIIYDLQTENDAVDIVIE